MTPELWERLKPLFHAAADKPSGERDAFIAQVCGEDAELRQYLVGLLEAHDQPTQAEDGLGINLKKLLSTPKEAFSPGELVLGRFKIVRPIGSGGMGDVYEAIDTHLGHTVALKTIRPAIAGNAEILARFKKEVQLAQRVSGRNVCRIHDLFMVPGQDGVPDRAFLTMEFLGGTTLARKLRKDGPLPWKEAQRIAPDICEGLRLIHEQGIIHRDLKTSNIMWCEQDGAVRIVLMDFGLAHDFKLHKASTEKAIDGETQPPSTEEPLAGTPEYMAPEQFEGTPVSPATDIYALGIVLYELVTGAHPYAAPTPIEAAIRRAKPLQPPSSVDRRIPHQWDRIIERCMEYKPEQRYQSAAEVAKALRAGPANLENLRKDRPWVLRTAFVIVLVAITLVLVHLWKARQIYRPSGQVMHWYNSGLAALREGTYVKAIRSLEQAVGQDEHFGMAHARLAEAMSDLDFEGDAQRHLLLAVPEEGRLAPLDRMYLKAIHATISRDYKQAITDYQQILHRLPPNEQSAGYVDLGMAYEHSGDPAHALENYAKAAQLDHDSPAPYMHTAILQTRLHHVSEADKAFQRAQTLFTAEVNQEGLAELDYERGYAFNYRGDHLRAEEFLKRSLDEASMIGSTQLQIRSLSQLSSAAYSTDRDAMAEEYADQAIRLARSNGLDSWAADGIIRRANAKIHQGKLQQAQDTLQEALQLAHQSKQPRLEALANLTLASLMDQKHRADDVIGPAQAALNYYNQYGFFAPAASASLLLTRAQRDKGEYAQALQSGNALLDLASKSDSSHLMMSAEEVVGTIHFYMEHYPDALVHFQAAYAFADAASSKAIQQLHCARVLWTLGRYDESDAMLNSVPRTEAYEVYVAQNRIASLLSRQRYKEAGALAQATLTEVAGLDANLKNEFEMDLALALAHQGMKKKALDQLPEIAQGETPSDASMGWPDKLTVAEVKLYAGKAQEARDLAASAANHFASTGQLDSGLRSLCLAAAASREMKDARSYELYRKKAVDNLATLQQTWDPQALKLYLSRPDLRALMSGISLPGPSDRR